MRKKIIYRTAIGILFILSFFFTEYLVAQERFYYSILMPTYKGPTVTISGRIDYPDYKEGERIRIFAKSFPVKGLTDIAYVDIPRPGEYSLKVPQNIGDVYIGAVVLKPTQRTSRRGDSPGKEYDGNPLKVSSSDIKDVDMIIRKPLMPTYKGPTVTISGRIDYPDYKEGERIRIFAKSFPGKGSPDIAYVDIPRPGEYSLKVPQNIGDVYIGAVVLKPTQRTSRRGGSPGKEYGGNPLKVSSSDIKDVNIIIKGLVPLMSTYKGPTVTISGRIDYPDYKEGERIRISAESFPAEGPTDIAYINIAYVDISRPGEYSLKVPQNIGDVYIGAVVLKPTQRASRRGGSPGKEYDGNPLKVSSSDIKDVDMIIRKPPLMSTYEGPTVTISGRIDYPDYKEGERISIFAKSFPLKGPTDITSVEISQPGEYSLNVPQNIGDVYVGAVVMEPGQMDPTKDSLRRKYDKNPIEVKTKDISGVNITLP